MNPCVYRGRASTCGRAAIGSSCRVSARPGRHGRSGARSRRGAGRLGDPMSAEACLLEQRRQGRERLLRHALLAQDAPQVLAWRLGRAPAEFPLGEHVLHPRVRLDHGGAGIGRIAQRDERGVDRVSCDLRLVVVRYRGRLGRARLVRRRGGTPAPPPAPAAETRQAPADAHQFAEDRRGDPSQRGRGDRSQQPPQPGRRPRRAEAVRLWGVYLGRQLARNRIFGGDHADLDQLRAARHVRLRSLADRPVAGGRDRADQRREHDHGGWRSNGRDAHRCGELTRRAGGVG